MSSVAQRSSLPPRDAALAFDLNDLPDDFIQDPFSWYHALREHDPVHRCPDGSYLITRYADCAQVYRDPPRFISDKRRVFGAKFGECPLYRHHTTSLVFSDPPYHTRVRRLIAGALKPAAVKAMAPGLEALVESLLDRIESKGEFDLIEDYASAIPIEIIGNLLRVPREDRDPLRGWSLLILGALEWILSDEQLAAGNRAVEEFSVYLEGLIEDRRRNLSDDPGDILSTLIRGEDGERLSEEELIQNCVFLLNAGHETTTNLIGNGVYTLLMNPGELARLREDPAKVKPAVEEVLRYQSPNQLGNRETAEDVELGGVSIPAGTNIHICIGGANRDPEHFAEPDRFDITRSPNNHLAFASGIHMCVGMPLARLEGQIAIARIFQRFPRLRVTGEPVLNNRARFRGFGSAPMAVE